MLELIFAVYSFPFLSITNYIRAVLKIILQEIFQYIFFHVYFILITFSCNYWKLWHELYIMKHNFLSILDILDLPLRNCKSSGLGVILSILQENVFSDPRPLFQVLGWQRNYTFKRNTLDHFVWHWFAIIYIYIYIKKNRNQVFIH